MYLMYLTLRISATELRVDNIKTQNPPPLLLDNTNSNGSVVNRSWSSLHGGPLLNLINLLLSMLGRQTTVSK